MQTGVYQIRNLINNRLYIGSTTASFGARWRKHRGSLSKQCHHSAKLQNAWNKYNEAVFVFEVLETCAPEQCIEREQYHLDTSLFASCQDKRFDQLGYNICRIAKNCLGIKRSNDTKIKMSEAHKGKIISEATKVKMSMVRQGKYQGENHPCAKLTEEDVRRICFLLRQGTTQQAIALQFGVAQNAISRIKTKKTWSHIEVS